MADERFSGSTAYHVVRERTGRPSTFSERSVSTATGWQVILLNNPRRLFWLIINRGVDTVYIRFTPNVSYTSCIPLAPLGGTASMSVDEDGEAVTAEVSLYASTSSLPVYILEVIAL